MRLPRLSSIAGLLAISFSAISQATTRGTTFEEEVKAVSKQHAPDIQKASSLAARGEVEAGNRQLLALTEEDKSPAMAFVIANLLYKMDPQVSYDLHRKVYETQPEEPNVNLEWAMEHHRRGEYAEAIPLYQKFIASRPGSQYSALLAECLLREGKLKEAVAAWGAAGHPRQHTDIDFAICEIHGEIAALRRRADLLQRLGKGEGQVAEKLIDLDLHMDRDWWNSGPSQRGLEQDLPLIEKALGSNSERYKVIRCWVNIAKVTDPQPADITTELKRNGLIVAGGKLPGESLVAARLIAIVQDNKIETDGQLFERFGKELLARAKSAAGDAEALNILCALSMGGQTADRLAEYDRYGYERYGEFRFLGSLLAYLGTKGKLTADSPELKAALEKFSDNSLVHQMAIRCAGEEKVTKEMLVAAIKAEYHKLSTGMGGYPDSYTLKAYFALLNQEL
jgi:tetratricopeptide (TPR) repeat protein